MRSRGILASVVAITFALSGLTLGVATASAVEYTYSPDLSRAGFDSPRAVTTDEYGDIYVASYGREEGEPNGRIDVFDPEGNQLTQITGLAGPKSVAVDSKGNLYLFLDRGRVSEILRFSSPPGGYEPQEGKIEYESSPTVIREGLANFVMGLSINRSNDHLFAHLGFKIVEFGSAEEGTPNPEVESFGLGTLHTSVGAGLAVDAEAGFIYASQGTGEAGDPYRIVVFELAPPHNIVREIEGSELPGGKFVAEPAIAVDEATGNLFLYYESDPASPPVYEITPSGEFVEEINHGIKYPFGGSQAAIDNGPFSPNEGDLFVPSKPASVLAFEPREVKAPEILSASSAGVTESEAKLRGSILPGNLDTTYAFEYTTEAAFAEHGFQGAIVASSGQIPEGAEAVPVSAALTGLAPGGSYRFRLRATNEIGEDEAQGGFATYRAPDASRECPNGTLRTGPSAALPDCRAYELVTPANTNGLNPIGLGHTGLFFPSREASPDGNAVSFQIQGGTIPGLGGTGSLAGDPYRAARGPNGWSSVLTGPSPSEAWAPLPGASSPDQGYTVWDTNFPNGTALIEGRQTVYLSYPDGRKAPLGRGSLAVDPEAQPKLISEDGGHVIFASGFAAVQLEPDAPPTGTRAIYDRTPDEVTHVVSLLPGEVTPGEGEGASYVGASLDGRGVAFKIGGVLYLRRDDTATYEIGAGLTYAGISEGGGRIFYLQGGDLKAFDAASGETISFTASGDVTPVNVSADGSSAYFVSPSVLPSTSEPAKNPEGDIPVEEEENLYRSHEGQIAFLGTVTERDVVGEKSPTNKDVDGLGLWLEVVGSGSGENPGLPGADSSRATPDGSALLFESRANLTEYDSGGHAEVYRYDAAGSLACLSCNPTGAAAIADASLQSLNGRLGDTEPLVTSNLLGNLTPDGQRAFFQSPEALVLGDTDGLQDVYEWEEEGVGSCRTPGGCTYLISSGTSAHPNYLYATSDSGDDVFISTSDLLTAEDPDETASIYDARVEGGFARPGTPGECLGEACQPAVSMPSAKTPTSAAFQGAGNVGAKKARARRCPKGRRPVKRGRKRRCVKKAHRRRHPSHHRRAHTKGRKQR
jgi:hypothetical protein